MNHVPSLDVVKRAAEWAVLLDSPTVQQTQRDACEAWCNESPLHRLAYERMCSLGTRFDALDEVGRRTLERVKARRGRSKTRAVKATVAACMAVAVAWSALQTYAVREMFPDYQTARGEQRTLELADASSVVIDTDSAMNVAMDNESRKVTLFRGQIMASVAKDPARAFVVETRDGAVTALGTAFVVRRDETGTLITVLESRVRACPPAGNGCVELGAGEQTKLAGGYASTPKRVDTGAFGAWSRGWLEVDDRPLADVLTELARYHTRPLRFDPAALRGIHVTGSYPLAAPDRALDAIAGSARVRIERPAAGSIAVVPAK